MKVKERDEVTASKEERICKQVSQSQKSLDGTITLSKLNLLRRGYCGMM